MSIYVKILEYNIRAPHFNGIIFYSDNPITPFLSCKAGVNILFSKMYNKPKELLYSLRYLNQILNEGLPNDNYLFGAFCCTFNNKEIISCFSHMRP